MPDAPPCPHAEAVRRLIAGACPPAEAARLRAHVAACRSCLGLLSARKPAAPETTPDPAPTDAPPPTAPGRADGLDFLAPPQSADELGRLGDYKVLAVLGSGGMGMVLLAEDVRLRRSVALKVMQPRLAVVKDARERFLREARAAAAIDHDNVVPIYQVGEDRGTPFLAMPLLRGRTLADVLRATPRLPVPEAVRIAREVATGLAAAHAAGLIHRDIKPANVWLEDRPDAHPDGPPRPRVRILDFGLARPMSRPPAGGPAAPTDPDDGSLTATGVVLGTPGYMSPEQAAGRRVDHRTDLFSLGAVLYEMLLGIPPFRAADNAAILALIESFEPPPPGRVHAAVPADLDAIVAKLMAKDPAKRPPTARAVAVELGRVLASLSAPPTKPAAPPAGDSVVPFGSPSGSVRAAGGSSKKPRPRPKTPPPPERSAVSDLWWAGVGGLAGVTVVAVVAAVIVSGRNSPPPTGQDPRTLVPAPDAKPPPDAPAG